MTNLSTLNRSARSIFTLNRDREYITLHNFLALQPTNRLLDVGSGDGFWTARFAKHCAHVTGLEPDSKLLKYARTLHRRRNIKYVDGVAESLPFADDTFDKVVSVSCLEHFASPHQGLREMVRVLKPGGRLALSVDTLLAQNSPATFRDWHRRRHFVTQYFSQDELLEMMAEAGLHGTPERTVHLFRSRAATHLRQVFIRHPRFWLPLFPLFYCGVRLADATLNERHGQIIIVGATYRL